MGLGVWFQEDVARVLRVAHLAGRDAPLCFADNPLGSGNEDNQQSLGVRPGSREMAAYWHGYEAALATIGAAFGLAPGTLHSETETQPQDPHMAGYWE